MREIVMVDVGISNLGSVVEAFRRAAAPPLRITRDPADLDDAPAIVLPGVGSFADGMAALHEHHLVEPIQRHVAGGRPLLGICLGMQLLGERSEEHGEHEGLGVVPGRTVRLTPAEPALRVPNIGWCDVTATRSGPLFREPGNGSSFYFAHSFRFEPRDAGDVAATMDYGGPVVAAIERGPVLGVQFHPEKSQDAGLAVLESFCEAL
jgi:imidazole glycerol-phosphate synthase subunit HisH